MKIILFSRPSVSHRVEDLHRIFASIDSFGFDYCVNEEFAEVIEQTINISVPKKKRYGSQVSDQRRTEAVMVCYGGDGTILEGLHRLAGQAIAVAGINSGRLGFLSTVSCEGIEELFDRIARGALNAEGRAMLAVEGDFLEGEQLYAANEFSVQRHGAAMIVVDTYVDGQMVATYHGDGVIVSTPTGSTAYSLSAGGPILTPQCGSWVISPLAPHNITMRPVVVPDGCTIEMEIRVRDGEAFVSLDNRTYMVGKSAKMKIFRAEREFFLALPGNISFYETLRNKMMWGVDLRG
ncbi:MAG: NAD(+)/NADH kinase [Rikenellaceae bacterium]